MTWKNSKAVITIKTKQLFGRGQKEENKNFSIICWCLFRFSFLSPIFFFFCFFLLFVYRASALIVSWLMLFLYTALLTCIYVFVSFLFLYFSIFLLFPFFFFFSEVLYIFGWFFFLQAGCLCNTGSINLIQVSIHLLLWYFYCSSFAEAFIQVQNVWQFLFFPQH